jgi:ABC-type spermidine/putrescine transport system permease subunit II
VAAFSERWAGTPWPTKLSWMNFEKVLIHALGPLKNSLTLSLTATLLAVVVGSLIAYIMEDVYED